jgi:hypothetical protein
MILTHYYERGCGPFKSISGLTEDEAKRIMAGIDKAGTADRRDFGNMQYLAMRKEVEAWLRTEFIKKGGRPVRENPHYLVVNRCSWLSEWYREPAEVTIPLSSIDPSAVSFTYPDSMISLQLSQRRDDPVWEPHMRPWHGQVFTIHEINDVIDKYGFPDEHLFRTDRAHKFEAYIEAQVWSDEPLAQLMIR